MQKKDNRSLLIKYLRLFLDDKDAINDKVHLTRYLATTLVLLKIIHVFPHEAAAVADMIIGSLIVATMLHLLLIITSNSNAWV